MLRRLRAVFAFGVQVDDVDWNDWIPEASGPACSDGIVPLPILHHFDGVSLGWMDLVSPRVINLRLIRTLLLRSDECVFKLFDAYILFSYTDSDDPRHR